eukprot:TRINITY_DN2065_c0_g1_i1.p1 TRINITY_DN2065_c0_g1~~TRINITY_DN2065_c0_g1_i1.p1  ORF type:complete len:132 (-),score=31.21 TRINITY_DN2065_c0_g1_i1:130-525(-)
MCREEAQDVSSHYDEFEEMGVRVVGICQEILGAQQFADVYFEGDMFIDLDKGFFKAQGYRKKSNWSALTPSALSNVMRAKKKVSDYNLKGIGNILGGVLVVTNNEVVYEHRESIFGDIVNVDELLQFCRGL